MNAIVFESSVWGFSVCPIQMRESPRTKVKTCSAASEARRGARLNLAHVLLRLKLPPCPTFTFSYSLSSANTLLLSKLGTCMGLHSGGFVLLDQGGVSARTVFLYPPIHHPPSCPPSPYFLHTVSSQAFLWYLYFPPSTCRAHTDLGFSSAWRDGPCILPPRWFLTSHMAENRRRSWRSSQILSRFSVPYLTRARRLVDTLVQRVFLFVVFALQELKPAVGTGCCNHVQGAAWGWE